MNTLPQKGILAAAILIALGLLGYFAGGRASMTALIPAFFGIPLLFSSLLARKAQPTKTRNASRRPLRSPRIHRSFGTHHPQVGSRRARDGHGHHLHASDGRGLRRLRFPLRAVLPRRSKVKMIPALKGRYHLSR